MARLAWFSPMPPARSGVATYSAEVVEALRGEHLIDVYSEEKAHDFLWTHLQHPYELIVYQLGNSTLHEFIWPYLFRYPGLVVLHDARLHHARAAALLRRERRDEYRREFAANHPDAVLDAAELAVAGYDNHLYYNWSMTGLVVESSRVTAVHSPLVAKDLQRRYPKASIATIRLSHGEVVDDDRIREGRTRIRAQYGIPDDAVLFGVFGGLTPEKRLPQILAALQSTLVYRPNVRLLLAGAPVSHYDLAADIQKHGLQGAATMAGYRERDEDFTDHLVACDVSLNLRWPTAQEVSGPWLRAMAAARPTIMMDLAHTADVPALDPRTWTVSPVGAPGHPNPAPVAVAIDILDEDHSLRLAMRRLAMDPDLRARLGTSAREYWLRNHAKHHMLDDYRRAIAQAVRAGREKEPDTPLLPEHLRDSAERKLHELLQPFGLPSDPWSSKL